jgi:hypothetical protein
MSDRRKESTISFHPILARIAHGVPGGLMLSQGLYWMEVVLADPSRDGWFYKTQAEWMQETTLTRWEQETARRSLRKTNFWFEKRRGVPAKMHFRIDLNLLEDAIRQCEEIQHSSSRPIVGRLGCEGTHLSARVPQTITESTHERTSENCGRFAANSISSVQSKKHVHRYLRIQKFAKMAVHIMEREPDLCDGDVEEKLKTWAAERDIEYFDALPGANPPIAQALINAHAVLAKRRS